MTNSHQDRSFLDALKIADIRLFIGSVGFFTLASRAITVVIGFQIYRMTRSPLALGWLGLIEAIPAISLVLFGGYVADHFNRRKILLITRAVSVLCAVLLAQISLQNGSAALLGLYSMVFLAGIARAFADPASTAFEAQIVPQHLTVNASSWITTVWISCSVVGPAAIGFAFDACGASKSYLFISACFVLSWICTFFILPKPRALSESRESVFKNISIGWNFTIKNQPLFAGMMLDLFAVLFGGAVALLPIYADDILHVGAKGLGFLNAAPSLGAFLMTLFATKHPPIARAGQNLIFAVLGFGTSILIFAFSKNFALSLLALFASGAFDGVSMVIRRSMLRLLSPNYLRGRVAAASWIFICASNELGAFESGMVAALIGTVPCVAFGGVMTLVIVGLTAAFAKELRELRFDINTLERQKIL